MLPDAQKQNAQERRLKLRVGDLLKKKKNHTTGVRYDL